MTAVENEEDSGQGHTPETLQARDVMIDLIRKLDPDFDPAGDHDTITIQAADDPSVVLNIPVVVKEIGDTVVIMPTPFSSTGSDSYRWIHPSPLKELKESGQVQ